MNATRLFVIVLVLACAAGDALAGSRAGGPYTVTDAVAAQGDGCRTGGAYTACASVGGVVGVSTSAAPVQVARHGYVAGLYEVASLGAYVAATNIAHGGTRQVYPLAILDDNTTLVLALTDPAWSIDGPPLASVSSSGLVTAGTPGVSSCGTVRLSYHGLWSQVVLLVSGVPKGTIFRF